MAIGTIPFNHRSRYLYFSECPKGPKMGAAVLGVWRETITAAPNRWSSEGLIVQQSGRITLKEFKWLQEMAED